MLNRVIRAALENRGMVLLLAILTMALGAWSAARLPIDVFPDLDRPRVVMLTECPGTSPEEVEILVAQPIETAILGAPGVQAVRSQSSQGLAVTYVEFGWRTETRAARQIVQERLAAISGMLPPGIRPLMTPPSSIMGQIMHAGLQRQRGPTGGELAPVTGMPWMAEKDGASLKLWNTMGTRNPDLWKPVAIGRTEWAHSEKGWTAKFLHENKNRSVSFPTPGADRMELRTIADWIIRPRLLREQGVAEVIVLGGDRKQFQVLVDPTALHEYGVSIQEVDKAIQENNLNASGGFTEEGQVERPIRVIARLGPGSGKVIDDLSKIPVKATGPRPILLGQVADIAEGPGPKRGDAGIDGKDAVVITVVKQPHADTREVTNRVEAVLRDIESSLDPGLAIQSDLFKLRDFIDRGIHYVSEGLAIGAVLVVVILFLFLLNLRATFITLTAIPLSLAVTALVFQATGLLFNTNLSINVMTLGGIAVAMGELVDDAIVDVENIHRRLGENSMLPNPKSALRVVYEASLEVRSAIVYGTAVVVLAFAPLFALSGVEGRLFAPLGVAYIVSILASLLVSLTVTPVLSHHLLGRARGHARGDGLLLRALKFLAARLIRFSMARAGLLIVLTWTAVAWAGWQFTRLGSDFLPKFDEGSIQINVTLPAGASLQASNDVAALIDRRLRLMKADEARPDAPVRHFVRRTGRAELDEHAEPVGKSEYILSMNGTSPVGRAEMLALLLADLRENVPGVEFEAEQPMAHLISHMLSGVQAEIAIKVFGDDLDQLGALAGKIRAVIATIPGITPPVVDPQETVDELHIVPRTDDMARFGLSRQYVAQFIETTMRGEVISQILEGQRRFDLVLKLNAAHRTDYLQLGELRIDLPSGKGQVRLKDIADIPEAAGGPNQVNRENVRRRAVIRCNTQGRDLGSLVAEIGRRVDAGVRLPPGYFVEYGGQFEAQKSAASLMVVLALASLAGVCLVLHALFPSAMICMQIMNAVPTAFVGGVIALAITGQTVTVASLVGFVSLGGIAVRNGILLVAHYVHLIHDEKAAFSPETILRGSLERLAPVLMTALTAGIGLVPLVAGGQKPGLEILYPVSTVILGGLATSTFCEFLIHPGLFWRFSGNDAIRSARGAFAVSSGQAKSSELLSNPVS